MSTIFDVANDIATSASLGQWIVSDYRGRPLITSLMGYGSYLLIDDKGTALDMMIRPSGSLYNYDVLQMKVSNIAAHVEFTPVDRVSFDSREETKDTMPTLIRDADTISSASIRVITR